MKHLNNWPSLRCTVSQVHPQISSHLVVISEVQVTFLTDITDKYILQMDLWATHTPGLYGPHTVNSTGMVSAHTPFLYITAVVSLGEEINVISNII